VSATGRAVLLATALAWGCGDGKSGGTDASLYYPSNYDASLDPFDERAFTSYRLQMEPADWDAIVADPFSDTWRRATLDWQGELWNDVAVRAVGQRSRVPGNPKPSIRIKFNYFVPHRKFHRRFLTGVRLGSDTNDPSMIRRRLEDGIYRDSGLPAPRCVHARLYVNDAYKGLYVVEERLNRGFVKEHFSSTHINQMYDFAPDADAFPGHNDDVTWAGPDPALYVPHLFAPQLRELDPANPDLKVPKPEQVRDFVDVVNNQPWETIATKVHIEHFCRFMAAEVVTGEGDGYVAYRASGAPPFRSSNFRIYPDPRSGKWVVLAWDREEGYWVARDSIVTGFDQRILTKNLLLADASALARYYEILDGLVRGPASVTSMNQRIDFIVDQVREAAAEDPFKTAGTTENWLAHIQTIRDYIARQNAMVQSQLVR
jgi:spore coat protein CotH